MSTYGEHDTERSRTVIEAVSPSVDEGGFAAKHIVNERVPVTAYVFADGHDKVAAALHYRNSTDAQRNIWRETLMTPGVNDFFSAHFTPDTVGEWEFRIQSWIDHFASLRYAISKKSEAGVESKLDQLELAALLEKALQNAEASNPVAYGLPGEDATKARRLFADTIETITSSPESPKAIGAALESSLPELYYQYGPRSFATVTTNTYPLWVDRRRAGFAAWYELFPRSTASAEERHGTFADVEKRLEYVSRLGFDIVYLPPIHPIGRVNRKGPDNSLTPAREDPGSPWAIGSAEGGHTSVHPELGNVESFDRLVETAAEYELEVALDIAFQCAPDHPWVAEHPDWFNVRPDGSIQYAENPPKKYQDIYPLNFESEDWWGLWQALRDVFLYWMDHGVRIFRVDNPHTKAFPFWHWCIAELKARDPEVILLAEAFTRPNVMYRLGKLGFTLGYTYFTWRNTAQEMREYVEELTTAPVKWQFRPSFWPNTPDILHETLQTGGRAAFISRFVLASTLSANYGVYGPAFELQEHVPREPGSEEYLHSEKYEIRHWDLNAPHSLAWLLKLLNEIRRAHPALAKNDTVTFHDSDNAQLLCYSKSLFDSRGTVTDLILVVVNFDFHNTQSGWVEFSPSAVGLSNTAPISLTDLLTGETYTWRDRWNFVMLDPSALPVHVMSVGIGGAHFNE